MRFYAWALVSGLKWAVLLHAFLTYHLLSFEPKGTACAIFFCVAHVVCEPLFPGGHKAIDELGKRPRWRIVKTLIFAPAAGGLAVLASFSLAHKIHSISSATMRLGGIIAFALIAPGCALILLFRDLMIIIFWPAYPVKRAGLPSCRD